MQPANEACADAIGNITGKSVAILNRDGVPVEILSLDRATPLDVLAFLAGFLGRIDLEKMAQKEGKSFAHFLSGAIGARSIGAISPYPKDPE